MKNGKQLSNIDPTSPLDDDVTTTATNSKEINSLCELSVKQFQKQMDLNVDVLHKAAAGVLIVERRRRRENRSKFSEAVYDRDGNVEKVRWRICRVCPRLPNSTNLSSARRKKRKRRVDDGSRRRRRRDDDKSNNNNNNNNDYAQPTIVAFNFERFFLDNTATFYAKESEKRLESRESQRECANI